ncbi:hypothetical protein H5410_060945 [Solanum commersonii]|uniref:Uncharacterized protein n=1 Tax=Solanum commersonii TaxID=4109 RepID=A0A9J5W6D8_SOLCO|nr:hypothetical protein H5410_060945 [Solanum commersonii]
MKAECQGETVRNLLNGRGVVSYGINVHCLAVGRIDMVQNHFIVMVTRLKCNDRMGTSHQNIVSCHNVGPVGRKHVRYLLGVGKTLLCFCTARLNFSTSLLPGEGALGCLDFGASFV